MWGCSVIMIFFVQIYKSLGGLTSFNFFLMLLIFLNFLSLVMFFLLSNDKYFFEEWCSWCGFNCCFFIENFFKTSNSKLGVLKMHLKVLKLMGILFLFKYFLFFFFDLFYYQILFLLSVIIMFILFHYFIFSFFSFMIFSFFSFIRFTYEFIYIGLGYSVFEFSKESIFKVESKEEEKVKTNKSLFFLLKSKMLPSNFSFEEKTELWLGSGSFLGLWGFTVFTPSFIFIFSLIYGLDLLDLVKENCFIKQGCGLTYKEHKTLIYILFFIIIFLMEYLIWKFLVKLFEWLVLKISSFSLGEEELLKSKESFDEFNSLDLKSKMDK